jgi:polysaccharide biosynthesis/export protein
MNFLVSLIVASALVPQGGVPAPAQGPGAQAPAGPTGGVAEDALDVPVPQTPRGYIIGPDDQLRITVFGEAELTNTYRVGSDGLISFPLITRIMAGGLSVGEFEVRLKESLASGFLRNPQVRVEVDQYKSQSVFVTGEVRTPNEIQMTGSMTLLKALAMAGSPTTAASDELTIARRGSVGADGALLDDVIRVNWRDLQTGRISDVALADGDVINVPPAERFYIQGYVRNPGYYVLNTGMTVEQAVALAGGLNERGTFRGISVTRVVNGRTEKIDLRREDKVEADDVINVSQRMF